MILINLMTDAGVYCITMDQAKPIRKIVKDALKNKEQIMFDMQGVDVITALFLHGLFSKLCKKYTPEYIWFYLNFVNVKDHDILFTIKRCLESNHEYWNSET